jgi:hypothetical protein
LGLGRLEKGTSLAADQKLSLILCSGLSTSQIIIELFGRGPGVAIAREKVETIGGRWPSRYACGRRNDHPHERSAVHTRRSLDVNTRTAAVRNSMARPAPAARAAAPFRRLHPFRFFSCMSGRRATLGRSDLSILFEGFTCSYEHVGGLLTVAMFS